MAQAPKAYSYLRFSNPDQLRGDTLRRQTEAALAYAEQHDLELDQALTFRDLGVSAFRGANAIEGALGQFVAAVDSGRVARGSFLLVENLDRLSRDRIMPALNRFASLLEKGIIIVTLSDGKVYDADSLNRLPDLMLSLLVMSRAHEESELKSRRLKAAWQNKRDRAAAEGHKLTAMCPAWLRLRHGSFEVIENRAQIVRQIFALALSGHGIDGIAKQLNAQGVQPFFAYDRKANGWYGSYIRKILCNPAVIGHFQPMRRTWVDGKRSREPDGPLIEDYFPAIVDQTTFFRAKRAKLGATGKGSHPLANVLSGLLFCALCGGKMHYVGKGPPPKGGAYLTCDNARRKHTCNAKSVRYEMVRTMALDTLEGDQLLRHLLPAANNQLTQAENQKTALEASVSETEQAITNLLDTLQRVPSPAVEKRLADLEQRLQTQRHSLASVIEQIGAGEERYEDNVSAAQRLIKMAEEGQLSMDQLHVRINAALKKLIQRIDIELTEAKETHLHITLPEGQRFIVGGWPASDGSMRFVYDKGEGWQGPFRG
jgi:DNA invertase Pin-like site-specific DNA recombinase